MASLPTVQCPISTQQSIEVRDLYDFGGYKGRATWRLGFGVD
jgi:hypothetical protein